MKRALFGTAIIVLVPLAWSTPSLSERGVVWTEVWGASQSGSVLLALGPATSPAGAVSNRSIAPGDGYVEFGVDHAVDAACGLTRHGHRPDVEEIDFALRLDSTGHVAVVESGVVKTAGRAYTLGDRFRIGVEQDHVTYRHNGEPFFTSSARVVYPLRAQSILRGDGASLRGAVMAGSLVENVEWLGGDEVRVYANDVVKDRNGDGTGASALSAQAIASQDARLEWRVSDSVGNATVGLVSDRDAHTLLCGLRVQDGALLVVEKGQPLKKIGTAASDSRLAIGLRGDTVEYVQDGRVVDTSLLEMARPLRIAAVLRTLGAGIDGAVVSADLVRAAASAPFVSIPTGHYEEPQAVAVVPADRTAAVTYTTDGSSPIETAAEAKGVALSVEEDTVLKARAWTGGLAPSAVKVAEYTVGSTGREDAEWTRLANAIVGSTGRLTKTGTTDAWDAYAASTRAITSLDGYVETFAAETGDKVIGLSSSKDDVHAPIAFALEVAAGRIYVTEAGRRRAELGVSRAGDRLRVAITGGLIQYRRNGGLAYTSHVRPTLPLVARIFLRSPEAAFEQTVLAGRLEDAADEEQVAASRAQMLLTPPQLPTPEFSPAPGTYVNEVIVSISDVVGAAIHYTTDGVTEPSEASPLYVAPLSLAATTTLKAKAFFPPEWDPSATADGTYTVKVAAPTLSPAGGVFSGVRSVRVSSTTPGAVIRYTMNGGDPTEADPVISSAGTVLVAVTGTLRVKGFKSGLAASDTTSADFTFPRAGAIAGGGAFSLLAKPDGTLWAWGYNFYGQLGDDTQVQRALPVQVLRVSDAVAVAAAVHHSLALTSAGHVWAWGLNNAGQLGNGTLTSNLTLRSEVQDETGGVLTGVVAIAAGADHSVALKSDGTVWAWGANGYGQLGDGTTTNRTRAKLVAGITGATAIAAGFNHSLAVNGAGGGLWAWGLNNSGMLGDGTTTNRLSPVVIQGVDGTRTVEAGDGHSLAAGLDGLVSAWGLNTHGQLGDQTLLTRKAAVRVADLVGVSQIAASSVHSLALAGGHVWVWGQDSVGQLGDGDAANSDRSLAYELPAPSNVAVLAAGGSHSLALDDTGTVWAWGWNANSQLGDGTTVDRSSPVAISGPGFAWRVATPFPSPAPGTFSAAQTVTLTSATSGASLFYSTNGEDPATPYTAAVSIGVTTLLKARATKAGQPDSNVAEALYTLKALAPTFSPAGGNFATDTIVTISCPPTSCASQGLTVRYTTDGNDPSDVSPEYTSPLTITQATTLNAKAFKAGWSASDTRAGAYTFSRGTLAAPTLTPDGGTFLDSQSVTMSSITGATIRYTLDGTEPTAVSTAYSSPITATVTTVVKAKAFHPEWTASPTAAQTYTIKVGTAPTIGLASGDYTLGQAVTLTSPAGTTIRYTLDGSPPTTGSLEIASGTTLYLMKALTLEAVAYRAGCELSDPADATYTVTGTTSVLTVSAGPYHSVLANPDGAAWAWGSNANGVVGDGTTTQRTQPVSISTPTGVIRKVDAGLNTHNVAVDSDRKLWAWGYNYYGQVGDGSQLARYSPVAVSLPLPTDVISASAGGDFSIAAREGGGVWAWGINNYGQLATGSSTPSFVTSPREITTLSDVASVSAGQYHALAVKTNGTLWAWGYNAQGQLGNNSTSPQVEYDPVPVSNLTGVSAAAAGGLYSLALKTDGTVWAWGLGASATPTVPVQITSLTGAVALAAGNSHSLAVLSDGTLWAWGSNGDGQLGDGTQTNRSQPGLVPIPGPVIAAAAGTWHSLAVTLDGTVWAWGRNLNGQLGLGTTATPWLSPTRVSTTGYAWRVAVPTFNPLPGGYQAAKTVALTSLTTGATICYTTDGSDPSGCTSSVASGGTVSIAQSATLRAIATKAGMSPSEESQGAYVLTVGTVTLAPGPGTYSTDKDVTMSGPAGATIRYTTDGSPPTETNGTTYAGVAVPVTATQTLYARGFKQGWTASATAGGVYTMRVANPSLTPAGGSYSAVQTVTLATTTPGAAIHYTTDGREPTLVDPVATSVVVAQSTAVRAKAFRDGWTSSDTVAASYVLTLGSVATPTMDPPAGSYGEAQLVVLRSSTPNAQIRFTLDGSDPTLASQVYRAPITVDETATLKAKAYGGDLTPSATANAAYTIAAPAVAAPRFSPASGPFTTARAVTVTCATTGAVIHYTTDGDDPTTSDPTITAGATITVDRSMTLKAKAWLDETPSAERVGHYHVTGAVAAGEGHSLALGIDGSVWSWGTNTQGQLGDGTTTSHQQPASVKASAGVSLSGVVAIEAGNTYSLAIIDDGQVHGHVRGWGQNTYGQLGNGSTGASVVYPVEVRRDSTSGPALDGVVAVTASFSHTVALRSDGTVWAWGNNSYGQLGDNSTQNKSYAVSVKRASDGQPLDGVVAVAAAGATYQHSLALQADGTVWGWGYGRGIDGSTNVYTQAVPIAGISGAVAIAAGDRFSETVRVDGTVWAWGLNDLGQLGHGSTVTGTRPEPALNLTRAAQVQVGPVGTHAVAVVPGTAGDQTIWTWGYGAAGRLGDASDAANANRLEPAQVGGMVDVVTAGAGTSHTLAILGDGTVWAWGYWSGGALGRDTTWPAIQSRPMPVPSFTLGDESWVTADPDHDGLPTGYEWRLGTDPLKADTNDDGIPDGASVDQGLDPNEVDTDHDGVRNAVEVARGTDPLRADTDGDGTGDATDCFALDPTRSQCPSPDPDDTTPPTLQLDEPTNAVLISSLP